MRAGIAGWLSDPRLARAHGHAQRGEVLQGEVLYRAVLREHPDCTPASRALAALALDRGDIDTAHEHIRDALKFAPQDASLQLTHAQVLAQRGDFAEANVSLESLLSREPDHHVAWLVLGHLRETAGDNHGALRAWYQAVTRAQQAGLWLNHSSTDPSIVDVVMRSIEKLRQGRREALFQSFESVRVLHGSPALVRVERALAAHLGEIDASPIDPRQRPKFFYFPDLPAGPYHDPMLQPWAPALRDAWPALRDEALTLLAQDRDFVSFLGLKPGQRADSYVSGSNPNASWDAYFFYRHGQRFDEHHRRCPKTSAVLESIELCRVNRQAPEACFSLLRPQSTIVAHYGVTNTRLVMHLPLIVPEGCALNIIDAGEHHWKPGELMMFDDTFQHEAWNNADAPRLLLLMDCWNPHLTPPEQAAVKLLVEAIDSLEN
jgi:aspartate beta-hydroxylase